ncbi:MAG: hypothetical protein QG600_570 [Patescibacteria group bacterium]|nr:hypothetical protein [Patescibacteria group bacterium]
MERTQHEEQKPKAEFDVGFFTIDHLSTDPKGFTIRTRQNLYRRDRDPLTGLPSSPLALTPEQRTNLRRGMGSEAFFALPQDFPADKKPEVKKLFQLKDNVATMKESGASNDEIQAKLAELRSLTTELRPFLKEAGLQKRLGLKVGTRNVQKVGIRHLDRIGNELLMDVRPVSFPVYAVASSPEDSAEALDLGAVTGTAGILITADNKMVLQQRSKKNSPYGDMPGASFAGMFDGEYQDDKSGRLKDVTTETVKKSSADERFQEIAITDEDVTDFRIVGHARDHVREHDEFLLLAKTKLTAAEVAEKAKNAPRSSRKKDAEGDFHFEENFIIIDATPDAIEKLVTEVKCPLPPTHTAAYIAAGYNMILERPVSEGGGILSANRWKDELQAKVKANYETMNKIIQKYYQDNPTKLDDNLPGGKPKRNPQGYEPYYTPQDQGLPSLSAELLRTGLVKPDLVDEIKVETLKDTAHPEKVWLFDIDGVITNATTHEVEEPVILENILSSLKKGEPVAFNTGRTLNFALQHVIPHLLNAGLTDEQLANFYAVGEKGATTLFFKDGQFKMWRDKELVVDESLRAELDDFVTKEVGDTMFPGESKPSMLSPQLKEKLSPDLVDKFYSQDHDRVYAFASAMIEERGLQKTYRVDKTNIAIDVENRRMGKDLGARRIIDWLKMRNIEPSHFIGVGDSGSDHEMTNELYKHSQESTNTSKPTVEFIFAGNREKFMKYLLSLDLPTPSYDVVYTAPDTETKPITDKSFAEYLKTKTT